MSLPTQSNAVVVKGILEVSVASRKGSNIVSGFGVASCFLMAANALFAESARPFFFRPSFEAAICSRADTTKTIELKGADLWALGIPLLASAEGRSDVGELMVDAPFERSGGLGIGNLWSFSGGGGGSCASDTVDTVLSVP